MCNNPVDYTIEFLSYQSIYLPNYSLSIYLFLSFNYLSIYIPLFIDHPLSSLLMCLDLIDELIIKNIYDIVS